MLLHILRRWDDDVVFKNCARGVQEKGQKTYINDTIRSEFHKKFMKKYVFHGLPCCRVTIAGYRKTSIPVFSGFTDFSCF